MRYSDNGDRKAAKLARVFNGGVCRTKALLTRLAFGSQELVVANRDEPKRARIRVVSGRILPQRSPRNAEEIQSANASEG